jgi:hypothetical protein
MPTMFGIFYFCEELFPTDGADSFSEMSANYSAEISEGMSKSEGK